MKEMPDLLLSKTESRKRELKALGYYVISVWEHISHQEMKDKDKLQTFVDTLDVQPRLNKCDSFFEVHTNATKLFYEAKPDEEIRYVDFNPYIRT